jgi:hypothetical protein
MRFVPVSEHQSHTSAHISPRDTAERFATEARFLAHPHQRALLMGLIYGLGIWLFLLRNESRPWPIVLAAGMALFFGYSTVFAVRRRHRHSQFWTTPT